MYLKLDGLETQTCWTIMVSDVGLHYTTMIQWSKTKTLSV